MKKRVFSTLLLLFAASSALFAQGNFGLVFPQAESNLPKSKAAKPVCQRKEFVPMQTTLTPTADTVKLLVRGGYTVIDPAAV